MSGAAVFASCNRIAALVMRHMYLLAKSWPRIISLMYYPTVTMVLWAFLTVYLAPSNRFLSDAPGFFIGAVLTLIVGPVLFIVGLILAGVLAAVLFVPLLPFLIVGALVWLLVRANRRPAVA